MSLAMFAAPFDENYNNDSLTNTSDNANNILHKKRQQSHNKSHNKIA